MYKYNASFFKQDEKYLFRHVLLLTSNYLAYFVIPVTLCNNFFDIRETFSVSGFKGYLMHFASPSRKKQKNPPRKKFLIF